MSVDKDFLAKFKYNHCVGSSRYSGKRGKTESLFKYNHCVGSRDYPHLENRKEGNLNTTIVSVRVALQEKDLLTKHI